MKKPSIRIVLIFVSVGLLWVITIDKLSPDTTGLTPLELSTMVVTRDICAVILSSVFIYLLVKKSYKKFDRLQQEYNQLFTDHPYPMWIYDLETLSFLKVNKAAIANYGYSEKEFLNMTIKEIRPPEDVDKLIDRIKGLSNDPSRAGIWKHKRKNGEILMAKISTDSINFRNRQCRFVVAQDVTNKEALEQELKKSNSEINILVNSITDGFFIIDKSFTIQRSNESLKKMTQPAADTLTGRNLFELLPGFDNQFARSEFARAFETNEGINFESFHENKGMWLRTNAYPFKEELSVLLRDITKEKEDELRTIKNQQDLYALINNTADLIWSTDRNYRFHTFNKPYRDEYTRYVGENLWIGKQVFPPHMANDGQSAWKPLYDKALSGKSFSIEMKINVPGRGDRYAFIRFNPIFDKDHNTTGVGCFLHDITLARSYSQKIEIKNKNLKEITYTISHKLKEPLEDLLGITNLLDNSLPPKTQLEIVKNISSSAKRFDEIIKNMVMQTAQVSDADE